MAPNQESRFIMGECFNIQILSKWVYTRLDKETREILQERVYRLENTRSSIPSNRELVGMVGRHWKRSKDRRRSLGRSRGEI